VPPALAVATTGPPDGATVVLVHGSLDRSYSFRRVVGRLPDLRVVSYDRRGYGDSIAAGPPSGLEEHVADLLEIVGPGPATVVAHSFGAHIAVLAAMARPAAVVSLGLWEPPVPWMAFWPEAARESVARIASASDPPAVAERGAKLMMGKEKWFALSEEVRERWRAEGQAFMVDMASELEAPYDWTELRTPTIVGYGEQTWPWSVEACQRVAAILGCGTFVAAGEAHVAHATAPDRFAEFVRLAVALASD
jgi:pimeloyl-ACP methyl ester carboxylesterase